MRLYFYFTGSSNGNELRVSMRTLILVYAISSDMSRFLNTGLGQTLSKNIHGAC